MPVVSKKMALELVKFLKRVDIKGDFFDPLSGTVFEFARQMQSPNILKSNPNFECKFTFEKGQKPFIKAEYKDGQIWEMDVTGYKINDIRSEIFELAEDIQETEEMEGDGGTDDSDTKSSKGGKGAKGGKK